MFTWLAWSAVFCASCFVLAMDPLGFFATTGQSFLLLLMALAGTVLFGAFDAYESEGPAAQPQED
jgi:hypothetical protein